MAKTIATISGTALRPGVSRNGRWYKPEHIAGAVRQAQERIRGGSRPMVMLTFHGAGDDSREVAASLTDMTLAEDGSAGFTAALADTGAGWDIARLADTTDGKPAHLKNVSIRGAWTGKVRKERGPDGQLVETGDGLELDGIDFTRSPGVDGAEIKAFAWAGGGATETTQRVLITESVQEAHVTITEETAGTQPPGELREAIRALLGTRPVTETPALSKRGSGLSDDAGRAYADPGYQADKKQRYDLSTKANAKAAWSYVNQAGNAKKYSAPQLKRVKARIRAALKKFGVTVAAEGWTIDPAYQVTEELAAYAGDPGMCGSYSISASNGPTNICVSGYDLDPADLEAILRAACAGACQALACLDPDMDGDIDVPGAGSEDTDDDADDLATRLAAAIRGESADDLETLIAEATGSAAVTETAPEDPAPEPDAARQHETEVPAVSETTTTEAAQAPAAAIDPETLSAAVAKALADEKAARKARKAAKAAKAAESASGSAAAVAETDEERIERIVAEKVAAQLTQETDDQRIERLVSERMIAERQKLAEQGLGPARKGLEPHGKVDETTGGKPAGGPGLNQHGMPADWPDKPLHQFTTEEMDQYFGPVLTRHVLGDRADLLS